MHVIFVCYYSFACNSAGHISCLANELVRQGNQATVFVPFDKEKASQHGEVLYTPLLFDELDQFLHKQRLSCLSSIIVAWTPRENVRRFVQQLHQRTQVNYIVHLEDNEKVITAVNLGHGFEELLQMSPAEIEGRMAADGRLSHPHRFPEFISGATGVSAVIDTLLEFAGEGQLTHVFWPGYNSAFFRHRDLDLSRRRQLGIQDEEIVLAYTGTVHGANREEVLTLYLAVTVLNRCGLSAKLLRTGSDYIPLADGELRGLNDYVIQLGELNSQAEVASVMAMANIYVQPGRAGQFNDYRFPSKIPEFFSQGRPVIIPKANLGRFVINGKDCMVLQRGDAFEIADCVAQVCASPQLMGALGTNALAFAARHFQWTKIAERYSEFLNRSISTRNKHIKPNAIDSVPA